MTPGQTEAVAPGIVRIPSAHGNIWPGLALAGAIGLTAYFVAKLAFPYALAIGFEIPLAMLIGLALANLGATGDHVQAGSRFAVKYVLGVGIALLGLRLNLHAVAGIGSEAAVLVVAAMAVACGFAVLAGRWHGDQGRIALLLGIGSSVCGASAIAAAAPIVKAYDREMSSAVATITLFGTVAVFAFPLIGHALGLDVLTFGLWVGASVGDTAQTIATSAAYDTVGRDVAVVVKLLRTILLAPLLLVIAWAWSRSESGTTDSALAARKGLRKAIPFFVVGFVVLAGVRTLGYVDAETAADADPLIRGCFLVALAGLGLQTRLGEHSRPRPAPVFPRARDLDAARGWNPCGDPDLRPRPRPHRGRGGVEPGPAFSAGTSGAAVDEALTGRVLGTGIPGAGALSPVGDFHPGGPMHDQDDFAATTEPGEILDSERLLVAGTSNFGAPSARSDWAQGSVLSLATDQGATLTIPPRFAAAGDQASAADGAVRLYTAQSPEFLNRLPNAAAETADMPGVANPLGISAQQRVRPSLVRECPGPWRGGHWNRDRPRPRRSPALGGPEQTRRGRVRRFDHQSRLSARSRRARVRRCRQRVPRRLA